MISASQERRKIERLNSKIKIFQEQRDSKLKSLIEWIITQERIKNSLENFATVCFGKWDENTLAIYKNLEKSVEENLGNYVLVLNQEITAKGPNIHYLAEPSQLMPEPTSYIVKSNIQIGKLTNKLKFDVANKNLIFPAKKHIETDFESYNTTAIFHHQNLDLKISKEPIISNYFKLPHLFNAPHSISMSVAGFQSQILFGQEIKPFFEKNLDITNNNYQRIEEILK